MAAASTLEPADVATLDKDRDILIPTGVLVLPEPVIVENRGGSLSDIRAFGWQPVTQHQVLPDAQYPGIHLTCFMDRDGPIQPESWRIAAEVLTAVIFRVRAGNAALPLVSAYDVFEQTWSPPMPFLFQRRYGTEDRPLTRSYIRECLVATSQSAQITVAGKPLEWRPHDFRRIFVTDAIRSGLPPHIAAKICGHAALDTTMGYAAIYPQDVISHHRAFIARRRTERPSEEYRELTATEWDEFLAHFELRKVALGTCGRDYATPCQHENACVRCPLLRVDPAQMPRLQEIHANLIVRLQEAKDQGWLGEVATIETTMAAAAQKLEAMRELATQSSTVHLGMPDIRRDTGRSSADVERSFPSDPKLRG